MTNTVETKTGTFFRPMFFETHRKNFFRTKIFETETVFTSIFNADTLIFSFDIDTTFPDLFS